MKRMRFERLRDRVGDALWDEIEWNGVHVTTRREDLDGIVDCALAALGLDDLDAAADRMAQARYPTTWERVAPPARLAARAEHRLLLEAALLATDGGERADA